MTCLRYVLIVPLAVIGLATTAAAQESREETRARNLRAYEELLRSDLRTQKVAVLTEMMQFSEAQDAVFWPVYREYEFALSRLNDERIDGIELYAKNYENLSDSAANELMTKALDLESRRAALKQQYFAKLKTVLSPVVAAKALQLENQIQLLIDLQVAASLPVAK